MAIQILVVGGGIGGLSAALALARQGQPVQLLEQATHWGDAGAGIQLGPNVTRRLHALGLREALAATAARPAALCVHSAGSGAPLARLTLDRAFEQRHGAPYLCAHRADLHAALLGAVQSQGRVELHRGVRVSHIRAAPANRLQAQSEDERRWEVDALIGADGLWSQVRAAMEMPDTAPRPTGHTAWRALLPQQVLPATQRSPDIRVWLGARLHAVAYPVRAGEWLNIVVLAEAASSSDAASGSDARNWDQSASLAGLQQATGATCAALRALLEAPSHWRAWSLHDRAPLSEAAHMAQGRIALLGDAAHPMLPYLAQGAGMAIEDAVALAAALQDASAAQLPAALAQYAHARWARNARVQARAERNGRIFHASGPLRLARDAALRWGGERVLDVPWLYGH